MATTPAAKEPHSRRASDAYAIPNAAAASRYSTRPSTTNGTDSGAPWNGGSACATCANMAPSVMSWSHATATTA